MATPKRAEPVRDRVPMSELLASCAAARAVSTPPRRQPGHGGHDEHSTHEERVAYERGAAA